MYSGVGKLEARRLVTDFDELLIKLYGMNMLDAKIDRGVAISAMTEYENVEEAVVEVAKRRQLKSLREEAMSQLNASI